MVKWYMLPAAPVSFCSTAVRPPGAAGTGGAPGGGGSQLLVSFFFLFPSVHIMRLIKFPNQTIPSFG
uniref:Uncharacterized protein n=1 Tax=Arundo donax TaxID=35708 RepID=A0A0A8YT85_ARUDO